MSLSKELSYRHTPQTYSVLYSTVKERLQYFAENSPSKEACISYDSNDLDRRSSITCAELYKKACIFAKGLLKLGVKQGDIVAQSLPNGPEWMISTFGIQLAGALPLLFMFYRQDGVDIVNALKQSQKCTALIFDPGNDDNNWKICQSFIQDIQSGGCIQSHQISTLKYAISTRKGGIGVATIEDILGLGADNPNIKLPNLDPDDVAAILLTSGSTGTPKPVQYTHINFFEFAHQWIYKCDINESDIYFNANMFNWAGGYPHIFLLQGSTRVTCTNLLSFKSLAAVNTFIARAVEFEKCTKGFISVPCIYEMTKHGENNEWASSLKTIMAGGLPITGSCSKILNLMCEMFVVLYGITEIGLIAGSRIKKGDDHEDYNVGIPLPGVEMKIVDDNGKLLPPNQIGEIYVRPCNTHLGYLNDKVKTDDVFLSSRWYKTDDVGCMRENGTFVVSGRKSDVIIVGGELVSPSYLESVIQKHPGVQEVVVVAVPDENMFQQACACIIARPGHVLSRNTMSEFFQNEFTVMPACRGLVPKYYLFFDAFPKSSLGKTSRPEVKRIAFERIKTQHL